MRDIFAFLTQRPQNRFTPPGGIQLDRLRGDHALRLDLIDEAEKWYQLGFEICTRERCPVELFHKHGARLFLDEVLKKKEFLKA